jgi:hypothetical protein
MIGSSQMSELDTSTETTESAGRTKGSQSTAWIILAPAAILGIAAFLSDAVPGIVGSVLLTLSSSSFAWGLTALLAGFSRRSKKAAIVASMATLLIATATYYILVLGVSQRWRGGYLDDGGSADRMGLLSVERASIFWVVLSLGGGALLGLIAWRLRTGSNRESSMLVGLVFGLFSAQGLHTLFFQTVWLAMDSFGRHLLASAVSTITLAALAAAYLVKRRNLGTHLRTVLMSAVLCSALGLTAWRLIELARMHLSV